MGMLDYLPKRPSRERLLRGDTPAWIANSARAPYIAQVILSCPPWMTRSELQAIKERGKRLTAATGKVWHVDHIVPLNHPRICGLTVPWNLKLVPGTYNMRKGNAWDGGAQSHLFDLDSQGELF